MKALIFFSFFSLLLTGAQLLHAQSLDPHRWENRLLLLLTDDTDAMPYRTQLAALRQVPEELAERQLVIYHLTPEAYATGLPAVEWQTQASLYNRYRSKDAPFAVILIGLDGSVKLRRESVLSMKELFATIDAMPMRQAEIRREGQ